MEKEAISLFGTAANVPRFLKNTKDATLLQGTKIRPLTQSESSQQQKERLVGEGNGLIGDLGLGALGLVSKEKSKLIKDKIADAKMKMSDLDQKAAQKVIDKTKMKEGGFLHRRMTVKQPSAIAEYKTGDSISLPNGGGNVEKRILYDNDTRVPSLMAPVQQATQVATPLLASAYVAEKMFGDGEEKQAQDYGQLEMEKLSAELDKVAALKKVATLEELVDQTESMLKTANEEKHYYRGKAEQEGLDKQAALTKVAQLENELMTKESQYEEFYLRTKARERSKGVIKLAETLLETGLVKQAQFNKKVDFLMDCDDETLKLHYDLAKTASLGEKGLESSLYIIENGEREESPRHQMGLSAKGQTIGEAASDLLRK